MTTALPEAALGMPSLLLSGRGRVLEQPSVFPGDEGAPGVHGTVAEQTHGVSKVGWGRWGLKEVV